jgi:hypothetical protein
VGLERGRSEAESGLGREGYGGREVWQKERLKRIRMVLEEEKRWRFGVGSEGSEVWQEVDLLEEGRSWEGGLEEGGLERVRSGRKEIWSGRESGGMEVTSTRPLPADLPPS